MAPELRNERPCARRGTQLVFEALDDELLVYDRKSHRAHCLNAAAAALLRACTGTRNLQAIERAVSRELEAEVTREWVLWGLGQLSNAKLLEEAVDPKLVSRRKLLKAAIAVPLVTTILAPTPARAANSCKRAHQNCTFSSDCCAPLLCNPITGKCE